MTTAAEIQIRIMVILDCDGGDISLVEDHENIRVIIKITPGAIAESMFDVEQVDQIVKGLTPSTVAHTIEVGD